MQQRTGSIAGFYRAQVESAQDLTSASMEGFERIQQLALQALRQQIEFAAPTNGRVLLYGENGTGKELVAHLLHLKSARHDRPFVEMNCAAIPEELIEAGVVDGASGWQIFWHIKFPLILPAVGIVFILTYVGNFNAFDLVYTTQGALASPNFSTDLMGTLFYRTFFGQQLQLGNPTMGATVAAMMFLIILTGVLLYMYFWARRVQTYDL